MKPDVVAPGTKLVSLESQGSYLAKKYPAWHIAGSGKNAYFRLTGTSMSTAVVSGGVALLLDANPYMTPGQIKMALQMGATFVPDGGLVGAGAGSVSFPTSMKIADAGLLTGLLNTVGGLLGSSTGATFRDHGTMMDRLYGNTGMRLLGILDLGWLWQQGSEPGVLNLLGLGNPLQSIAPNRLIWGEVSNWSSSNHVVWGDTIQSPSGQHVVWGDSEHTNSNHVVWGDSIARDGAQ